MKSMANLEKQNRQKGQTIIEFILLLAMLVGLSFSFYAGFGGQISGLWLRIANQINDNSSTQLELE